MKNVRPFFSSKAFRKDVLGKYLRGGKAINWRNRGDALRDRRQWSEAAEAYERHLARNPADTAIWIQYGHMLKESGRLELAMASYNRSEELDPEDADRDIHMFHLRQRIAQQAAVTAQPASPTAAPPRSGAAAEAARPAHSAEDQLSQGTAPLDAALISARLRRKY